LKIAIFSRKSIYTGKGEPLFAILSVGLNQFFICQGFSTTTMKTILIGAVLNNVLDSIFIFKFNMGFFCVYSRFRVWKLNC